MPGESGKTWSICVSMIIEWPKYARSTKHSLYYNYNKPEGHVVSCSRVSKQQVRSTHISVTVYLSKCPPPPTGEVTFWVIPWNKAMSSMVWGRQALQTGRPSRVGRCRPISGYRWVSGYRPISGYRWASGCCPVSGCRPAGSGYPDTGRYPDIRQ